VAFFELFAARTCALSACRRHAQHCACSFLTHALGTDEQPVGARRVASGCVVRVRLHMCTP
jgi:hypothetical protein